jgi:hypothetical protein
MAFPSIPVNGQQATVNNILYTYNSTYGTWTRQATQISNVTIAGATSISPTTGALVVTGGAGVVGRLNVGGLVSALGDMYVIGNIYVAGNTTTVGTTEITTNDKNITLANNAVNPTAARGGGISVGPGGVYGNISVYDGQWVSPDNWDFKGIVTINGAPVTTNSFTADYGLITDAPNFQQDYGSIA